MALGHHHHHHHDHADDDTPLDAANQSLADALKASFGILKFLMFVLVVMYCFSGVQCVEENEQAVVLRFGKLLPGVRNAGLSVAFPYPVDETVVLPTKQSNVLPILSHWPAVPPGKEAESLDKVRSFGGIKPGIDGALVTADSALVHFQWKATYRIEDLRQYVQNVTDADQSVIEELLTTLVDNAAVRVVANYTAETATRRGTELVASAVRLAVNDQLRAMETGVEIVTLEIPRSSVPGQTIQAFNDVSTAENERTKAVADARQMENEILNREIGPIWKQLITHPDERTGADVVGLLDLRDAAQAAGDQTEVDRLSAEIDVLIDSEAGGAAGEALRRANGYYTEVVQHVKGDVEEYNAVLDEYLQSRELFVHRMWQRTLQRILNFDGVTKHYIAGLTDEVRIKIGPDPEQRRLDEARKLQEEAEQYDFTGPKKLHAYMPGMDIQHDD